MQGIASNRLIEASGGKIMSKNTKINFYLFMSVIGLPLLASIFLALIGADSKNIVVQCIVGPIIGFCCLSLFVTAFIMHREL